MNLKNHICQFAVVIFFFTSCIHREIKSTNEDRSIKMILIDNTSVDKNKDISDLVEEINIIALKEKSGNHIGDISKLFLSSGYYIVADMYNAGKILLFDRDGNFKKVILRTGLGPEECIQINDCWLNYKGELEAYDFAQKKIYQYDSLFNLKNIVKSTNFYLLNNIVRIPNTDGYVGYASFNLLNSPINGKRYHIAFLNKSLKIMNTCLFFDKIYEGVNYLNYTNHFYQYRDSIRFVRTLDNYIYNVKETGLEKIYKLVYKENQMPENVLDEIIGKHLEVFKSQNVNPNVKLKYFKDFSSFTGNWQENDKYVFIYSENKHKYEFVSLFNKQTNKIEFNSKYLCENKRFKIDIPNFSNYDAESNSFIGSIFGEDLKKHIYNDSKFQKEFTIEPTTFYVVNVKLKK